MPDKKQDDVSSNKEKGSAKADEKTLHTTDPQENMEGPVSSPMHKTGHAFETDETKEDAERTRDRNV